LNAETGVQEALRKAEEVRQKNQLKALTEYVVPETGTHEGNKHLAPDVKDLESAIHGDKPAKALEILKTMQSDHDAAVTKYIGLYGASIGKIVDAMLKLKAETDKKIETLRLDHK
jgi:hypothetical protein